MRKQNPYETQKRKESEQTARLTLADRRIGKTKIKKSAGKRRNSDDKSNNSSEAGK